MKEGWGGGRLLTLKVEEWVMNQGIGELLEGHREMSFLWPCCRGAYSCWLLDFSHVVSRLTSVRENPLVFKAKTLRQNVLAAFERKCNEIYEDIQVRNSWKRMHWERDLDRWALIVANFNCSYLSRGDRCQELLPWIPTPSGDARVPCVKQMTLVLSSYTSCML